MFDSKELFKYENRFYIFEDPALREELINKYYNNSLASHFGAAKTHKLFIRKYY